MLSIEGKIPEGEAPTDYDAWMKIAPIPDTESGLGLKYSSFEFTIYYIILKINT